MTWYPPEEWRVHRRFDPVTRTDEIYIATGWETRSLAADQPVPFIVEISTGPPVFRHVDPHLSPDPAEPTALRFPEGVLEAIAEHVKPGPSQGEIKRLEDTLAIERARVDKILDGAAALPYADPALPESDRTFEPSAHELAIRLDRLRIAEEQTRSRAADLRISLDLALRQANGIYMDHANLTDDETLRRLSVLVETLKGTIEHDDRLRT